jgi:Domain of unknown function (DUF5666)
MFRTVAAALVLLAAMSAFGSGRINGDQERGSIATTARIIKVNTKTRTMLVRSSGGPALRNAPAFEVPGFRIPRGIALPALAGIPYDYTVVTTGDTTFQDGADPLQFQDFKNGETISIHGVRSGRTLTASRVAKWG